MFFSLCLYMFFLIRFSFSTILLLIFHFPLFVYEIKKRKELSFIMKSQIEKKRYGFYCMDVLCQSSYFKETRVNNLYNYFMPIRNHISDYCIKQIYMFKKKEKYVNTLYSVLSNIGILFILGYAINKFLKEEIFIADIVWLISMINSFKFSLTSFSKAVAVNYNSMILMDYILDILDIEEEFYSKKILPKINQTHILEFKNVYFKYPGSLNYALQNVNVRISTGERIAIIGENGSGKSTILNLILRIYKPTKGNIYLDGIDIEEYDLHEFYKIFGVLFQDFCKYSVSVKDYISFNNFDAGNFRMALHNSLSENFIKLLPKKQDTLLTHLYKKAIASYLADNGSGLQLLDCFLKMQTFCS